MLPKMCGAPEGGGSAKGGFEYPRAYALGLKGATKQERQAGLDALCAEANARADLGIGAVWEPVAGHGIRPAAILSLNGASFATMALEAQANAAANPRVSPVMHLVLSWNEAETHSGKISNDDACWAAANILKRLGLGHHRQEITVHRDTIGVGKDLSDDPTAGNLHVHMIIERVDPTTGLAYDLTQFNLRFHHATRQEEIERGWEHDRGLYVVKERDGTEVIERASVAERKAWARERREERLESQERRAYEFYQQRDVKFSRYVNASVAPRFASAIETAIENGAPPWAELHLIAARYGTRIEEVVAENGTRSLRIRNVSTQAFREKQAAERAEFIARLPKREADARRALRPFDEAQREALDAERIRVLAGGETVPLRVKSKLSLPEYRNHEQSERDFALAVQADPALVSRAITCQASTFDRNDLDRYLVDRITDPDEIQRIETHIEEHDETLRVLDADTPLPLYTTTPILAIEDDLAERAGRFAGERVPFDQALLDVAIGQTESQVGFKLNAEQRSALARLGQRQVVIEGLPGTGKTTIMRAIKIDSDLRGIEVRAFTLAQAAAVRLQLESGVPSVNTARGRILEGLGEAIVPQDGRLIIDEASMVDSTTMDWIYRKCDERNCPVTVIGDLRQLQPIDAGAAFRIVKRAAVEHGGYTELKEIHRQKRDDHKLAVHLMADAIGEKDEETRLGLVQQSLDKLDGLGDIAVVKTRDAGIDTAVEKYRGFRDAGFADTLILASDKDTVRHLNEEIRRQYGFEGTGQTYDTAGGQREFAEGDRFIFLKNSLGKRGMGVTNGDVGTVLETKPNCITVQLGDGREINVNPATYADLDHGYATTIHKAQGASVSACVAVLDRSASAELSYTALSRSKHGLQLVIAESNFEHGVPSLAKSISNNISLKTTTHTYQELLDASGGQENLWATTTRERQESLDHPLRKVYQTEMAERAKIRDQRLLAEIKAHAGQVRHDDAPTNKRHQKRLNEIAEAYAAVPFGRWVRDYKEEARVREPGRDREPEVREPEMREPEPRNVREPGLTLIPRGRAKQLDDSVQPEKIDDEPKQETPDDAGRVPANTSDEPEIDDDLEMDHEFGLHL